mgnify:CR=1 FL=1
MDSAWRPPVAAPVSWRELTDIDSPARWTIDDADALIDRASAPDLKGWGFAEQALGPLLEKLASRVAPAKDSNRPCAAVGRIR